MKHLVVIAAVLGLAVSAPATLACGAHATAAKSAECPMMMKGVEKSATNLDNGVKLTISAKDATQVKALQTAMAAEAKDSACDCPMHAKGVKRSVENTANGVVIVLTSDDKAQVQKLQAFAATGTAAQGECPHQHKMNAAGDKA